MNFNRWRKVKILLHYLKARRGIQRRINTAFVAMTVLCASQPSLGIATAKEMLRCVHQGLEISASHMHRRVVVLECSISLKKNAFLGKSWLVFYLQFLRCWSFLESLHAWVWIWLSNYVYIYMYIHIYIYTYVYVYAYIDHCVYIKWRMHVYICIYLKFSLD